MRVSMPPCVCVAISIKSGRLPSFPLALPASCPGLAAFLSSLSSCVRETQGSRIAVPSRPRSASPRPCPSCATTTRPPVVWVVAGQTQVYSSNNHAVFPTSQLPSQSAMRPPLFPTCTLRVPSQRGTRGEKSRIVYTPWVRVCPSCLARRKLPSHH